MPVRVDYDVQSTWELLYRAKNRDPDSPEHGASYTYGRQWAIHAFDPHQVDGFLRKYRNRRDNLTGVIDNSQGLVVGCGFGFLLEELIDGGIADVWGADTSAWIHANKATEARSDVEGRILDKDIRDADATSFFKDFIGGSGRFSWVVTEELLSSYDDADLPGLLDSCEDVLKGGQTGKIVHLVLTGANAPFNAKTLSEWAALRPSHTWVDARTGEQA